MYDSHSNAYTCLVWGHTTLMHVTFELIADLYHIPFNIHVHPACQMSCNYSYQENIVLFTEFKIRMESTWKNGEYFTKCLTIHNIFGHFILFYGSSV